MSGPHLSLTAGPRARRALAGALLLPLLLLAGCISEERELEIGQKVAAQINTHVPLVEDVPVNLYVNQLGLLIARHSGRPDIPYRFYIVDTDAVNAFALPGGHEYVNRGLVERTRNVSELAGVLAHEIGHVAARHGVKNLQRQMRTRSMSGVLYRTILGRGPLLDQEALDLGGELWTAAHSRRDEHEADKLAVKYLIASGVDPNGMLTLFDGFAEEEKVDPHGAAEGWFSTHPSTVTRIRLARREIRQELPKTQEKLATQIPSYAEFLRRLRKLPPPPPMLPVRQMPGPLR